MLRGESPGNIRKADEVRTGKNSGWRGLGWSAHSRQMVAKDSWSSSALSQHFFPTLILGLWRSLERKSVRDRLTQGF